MSLELSVLSQRLAICKLPADAPIPNWVHGELTSITRTERELSIVASQAAIPAELKISNCWRALQVAGPLDFSLTGILNSLTAPLAKAEISVFAISTFDTDYLLLREADLDAAIRILQSSGHRFPNE